jgi:hypothetical protein
MAPETSKTMWISLFYLTVPFGTVFGFISSLGMVDIGFQYAFLIQGVGMVILGLLMMIYPH